MKCLTCLICFILAASCSGAKLSGTKDAESVMSDLKSEGSLLDQVVLNLLPKQLGISESLSTKLGDRVLSADLIGKLSDSSRDSLAIGQKDNVAEYRRKKVEEKNKEANADVEVPENQQKDKNTNKKSSDSKTNKAVNVAQAQAKSNIASRSLPNPSAVEHPHHGTNISELTTKPPSIKTTWHPAGDNATKPPHEHTTKPSQEPTKAPTTHKPETTNGTSTHKPETTKGTTPHKPESTTGTTSNKPSTVTTTTSSPNVTTQSTPTTTKKNSGSLVNPLLIVVMALPILSRLF